MIPVTDSIELDESEIHEVFVHASGPGGQNVNKVSTAVQLRFDVARSPALPDAVRARLIALGGRRITRDGILIIDAERFRSQKRNRDDALQRLLESDSGSRHVRQAATCDPPYPGVGEKAAGKQAEARRDQESTTARSTRVKTTRCPLNCGQPLKKY
jgi:ribosome-associated protein